MKTFEQIYTEFHGEEITDVKQLTQATFTGEELKAFCEFYSDQQNKELRQDLEQLMKSINKNFYVAEIQRLTKERDELLNVLEIKNAESKREIQRLTKEVEELKLRLSGKTFFNPFEQENTRLRELLYKTMPHVQTCEGSESKLLTDIDNALNHKP